MENQGIFGKIKSLYIIKNIFNYIKDTNLKLFLYSKYFQNKLNMEIIYKEIYLKKIGFDLDKYLHIEQKQYKKDILNKKYDNFLLENKINRKKFEEDLYKIIESKQTKDIDEEIIDFTKYSEKLINIDSPLFEIVSKASNIEKSYTIYSIYISQKNIDEYKLKNDYIKFFDKMNKSNIKYSSIFYNFNDKNKINYLKELNIDFNKIKKLALIEDEKDIDDYLDDSDEDEDKKNQNNNNFFRTLFSFNNIDSNLIFLRIEFKDKCILFPECFENINNFKLLKYLFIKSFHFNKNLNIKLSNLEILFSIDCRNIILSNNSNEKLKRLDLSSHQISNINILENKNFKELKALYLYDNNISDIKVLEKVKFEKLEKLNLRCSIIRYKYIRKC